MSDRILGAACLALAVGMAWVARGYVADFSYEPVGPRAFPLLLAGLLAVGGLWLLLRPGRGAAPAAGVATLPGAPATPVRWGTVGAAGATIVAYALLFERLGFPLATALMSLPVGLAFGGRWRPTLAAGAALGLGMYLVFDRLLDVVLPSGLLSVVLGGR
jgi:putative tricarboxylic transport membrane protein